MCAAETQPVRVTTPLGDSLRFLSMSLQEALGRPFQMTLELLSEDPNLAFDHVLGQRVTVELDRADGTTRYFNGQISAFSQAGQMAEQHRYQMQVQPWIAALSLSADCRIFQGMTVPEIIKTVFRDQGFSDFREVLAQQYREWEYLVQYRETDFNFVSRLMEQEGIYYFFEHDSDRHTLVLCDDSLNAHEPLPGNATIPYRPPTQNLVGEEHIFNWSRRQSVRSAEYRVRAFDFRKSTVTLDEESEERIPGADISEKQAVFDYPGEFFVSGDGLRYAEIRLEELQSNRDRAFARGDARGIYPGGLFTLDAFPREDENIQYLVVAATHDLRVGSYETNDEAAFAYECQCEVQPSTVPFRALRSTPKPVVQGLQTAIVVGPSGEEIHTDEHGRIKVQFHWDRVGEKDENSSCWVRVSQAWAGGNWGAFFLPRIGQEVLVEFVEGDPDRPIVTGRVYNDANPPPYALPANKTRSTIKTRSSKDGTPDNFNEIRFEDKKGDEELYFHAEKNQVIVVENDKTESVGHDNTETIGNDEQITVKHDRAKTVENNQSETIGVDKSIKVGRDHTETIGKNESLTVGENRDKTVGKNQTEKVGANKSITVADDHSESIGADKSVSVANDHNEKVGKDQAIAVGANQSLTVGKDWSVSVADKSTIDSGKDIAISGGTKASIRIADELSIQVGKAKITMKKNGDITIQGNKINIKGSGNVVIKGKKF